MKNSHLSDRLPEDLGDLHVSGPKDTAAGMKAIKDTMKNAWGKMGIGPGTRALLKLNQKGGIDCQSCAWPDPDERRTMAEFCENGAKAMADEGTTKRVDFDFFSQYSIRELAEKD